MKTVLLADDEAFILERLKHIIDWHEAGFSIIGTAQNGIEAFQKIEELHPDLVVADIHMPMLNGLDLCRTLQTIYTTDAMPQIIFLTGYSNLDYVREAIRYDARDYLLKPVRKEELLQSVTRLAQQIDETRQDTMQREDMQRKIEHYDEQHYQEMFYSILRGTLLEETALNRLKAQYDMLNAAEDMRCVVVRWWGEEKLKKEQKLWTWSVGNVIKEFLEDAQIQYLATQSISEFCFLCKGVEVEKLQAVVKRAGDAILPALKITINVGIGTEVRGIEQLAGSYNAACYAMLSVFAENRVQVSLWETATATTSQKMSIESTVYDLEAQVRCENMEGVQSVLDALFEKLELVPCDQQQIELLISNCLLFAQRTATQWKVPLDRVTKGYFHAHGVLQRYGTMATLKEFLIEMFATLINEKVASKDGAGNAILIKNVLAYIAAHYQDSTLQLKEIAAAQYISYSYLSAVFKKVMKQSITDYILHYRIHRAVQLMGQNTLSLTQIGEQVGFEDMKYFSKCFKKCTGFTPSAYRATLQ